MNNLLSCLDALEKRYPTKIAYFYGLMESLCLVAATFIVKVIRIRPAQISNFRSLSFVFYGYLVGQTMKYDFFTTSTKTNKMLIIRGLLGVIGVTVFFYGFKLLPLSESVVLGQTTPVMTACLSPFLLGEKFEKTTIWTLLLSMSGVILIAKPPIIFGEEENEAEINHLLGVVLILIGSFINTLVQIMIKKLGGKANNVIIVYYFGIVGTICTGLLGFADSFVLVTLKELILLLIIGALGFLGQMSKNRSFQLGSAAKVSMMTYTQIVMNYFLDIYILNTWPDRYSVLGSILIMSCILFVFFKK